MKKNSSERWIIYLGVVLIIMIISMNLYGYSFISPLIQKAFYILYILHSLYTLYLLREKEEIRLHHIIFTIFFIILITIILKNLMLAFPLLFMFPMLASKKSHIMFKCISWCMYVAVCLLFCLTISIRFGFVRTYTLYTEISPNEKQVASVIMHDEGALGGSIEVQYEKLYGGIIKKSKTIYRGGLNEPEIKWIGNNKIKIDEMIINIDDKDVMYKR